MREVNMVIQIISDHSHLRSAVARASWHPCDYKPECTGKPRKAHPLALAVKQAQHPNMTPGVQKHKPTAGALRAASKILQDTSLLASLPELIDRETGVPEILDILENIIAEAGDLIE